MRTIQEASNEIAKKAGYKGDFMTTQSALNYIAENIGVLSSGVGGEEEGFVDKNTGVIIDEWLGEQEEYDSAIKFANRRYSIYSKQGELLKQYCNRFKSPLDYFDNRLSMYLSVGENGLKYWNNPNDPMPIQGLDLVNKTLEDYCVEYVEGVYKIYSDGEVLDVMGYAGLGDLYNEAMKTIYEEEIARGVDIQSANPITSNIEFHRMLVEQLNKDNIARVESMPVTLDENREEIQPLVKSMQRVITAINFCCRVDLEDGSIYIGEGYENFAQKFRGKRGYTTNLVDGVLKNTFKKIEGETSNPYSEITNLDLKLGEPIYINVSYKNKGVKPYTRMWSEGTGSINDITILCTSKKDTTYIQLLSEKMPNDNDVIADSLITITKTATRKPFVKSMMPSGKLAFITNATSETHSFVMKRVISNNEGSWMFQTNNYDYVNGIGEEWYALNKIDNVLVSKDYKNVKVAGNGVGDVYFKFNPQVQNDRKFDSFSQLLIYKGNFTQAELEGELAKDIRLK